MMWISTHVWCARMVHESPYKHSTPQLADRTYEGQKGSMHWEISFCPKLGGV